MRETVLLAATLVLAGPARAQNGTAAGPVLAFAVSDSSLRGPATFVAGTVTIQLTNRGRGLHQLQLLQIGAGHTADEAKAFILANDAPPPWSRQGVGVGPVGIGQTITVTLKLDPGVYLLLDLMPDAAGKANYRAGLIAPFSGTGTARRDLANIPAAAGLNVQNRFRFGNLFRSGNTWTLSESRNRNTELRPGLQTIRIESYQGGIHSVVLARGGPELMRQYAEWREGRRPPPPGIVGGVGGLASGTRVFLQVRLTPGGYILFCPERNGTGLMGFDSGESTQFAVR